MSHITREYQTHDVDTNLFQGNRLTDDSTKDVNLCPTKFDSWFGDDCVNSDMKPRKNGLFKSYLLSLGVNTNESTIHNI